MGLWLKTIMGRTSAVVRVALLAGVVGLAILIPTTAVTVEYTARSEFCSSCHIMDPYYESWENSSHAHVSCIECHYEPGTLETVAGKFQALSQLAKYATRTEGTKPWAEVSDQSCMRSGCHSVPMLEGSIDFDGIKFDHGPHLLEARRGKRLRCVTCHSQIVQDEHFKVSRSVCVSCHFMPVEGEVRPETSDCLVCHESPREVLEVAGAPFVHADYLARGVDCRECHDPVIEGEGRVRRERCTSCHGELEFIERYEETAFLHEEHVTEHKVECFECHDEIHHGLMPLERASPAEQEGCGRCHVNSHDATRLMLGGTGGHGVEDRPSRMFEARVGCHACHTGRAGTGRNRAGQQGMPHHGASAVASAGAVDCIHCHGPGIQGMLEAWQASVEKPLATLRPRLEELESRRAELDTGGQRLLDGAHANVSLVTIDGSRGAHNVSYAIDLLQAAADQVTSLEEVLGADEPADAPEFPFLSGVGCSQCHLGVEYAADLDVEGVRFSHEVHLSAAALDCDACHSVEEHGEPSFARQDCATCHHAESEDPDSEFDPWDCSSCHAHQENFLIGELEGFEPLPGPMAEKDCESCHGEPPDIIAPKAQLCALCHDETYPAMPADWRARTEGLIARLEEALEGARGRSASPEAVGRAQQALEAVSADGSGGAHNIDLMQRLLSDAIEGLE